MKLFEIHTPEEMIDLGKEAIKIFYSLGFHIGFSDHFVWRAMAREERVSKDQVLDTLQKTKQRYKDKLLKAKKIPTESEFIVKDYQQDLNIVVGVHGDKLTFVTIKRKNPDEFVPNRRGGIELRV